LNESFEADAMTTVRIDLPDQLAQDAERAGLLSPAALEELLRKQLRTQSAGALQVAMDRISAVNDLPYMSPEDVAEEIAAMRAERRAAGNPTARPSSALTAAH
jgi:hypothetical protein